MIAFTKMQGTGNDYIYIYDLEKAREETLIKLIPKMCNRNFGIGADGVILINKSDYADFKMRMFNADGSEAQMCGNGIRCVGKYVKDKGLTNKKKVDIETKAGIKNLYLNEKKGKVDSVKVNIGKAKFNLSGSHEKIQHFKVVTSRGEYECYYLTLGNPHTVVILNNIIDLKNLDVEYIGKQIGENDLFEEKSNVEFVVIQNENKIFMRVWERGTGETSSCGTGACAVVMALNNLNLVNNKVDVEVLGGLLTVYIKANEAYLEGDAKFLYEGEYYDD